MEVECSTHFQDLNNVLPNKNTVSSKGKYKQSSNKVLLSNNTNIKKKETFYLRTSHKNMLNFLSLTNFTHFRYQFFLSGHVSYQFSVRDKIRETEEIKRKLDPPASSTSRHKREEENEQTLKPPHHRI